MFKKLTEEEDKDNKYFEEAINCHKINEKTLAAWYQELREMTVSSTLFLNKYKMDCALLTKICNFSTAEILDKSKGRLQRIYEMYQLV